MKKYLLFLLLFTFYPLTMVAWEGKFALDDISFSTFNETSSGPTDSYEDGKLLVSFYKYQHIDTHKIDYYSVFQFFAGDKRIYSANLDTAEYPIYIDYLPNPDMKEVGLPLKDLYVLTDGPYALQAFLLYNQNNTPLAIRIQVFLRKKLVLSSSFKFDADKWQILTSFFKDFKSKI